MQILEKKNLTKIVGKVDENLTKIWMKILRKIDENFGKT